MYEYESYNKFIFQILIRTNKRVRNEISLKD